MNNETIGSKIRNYRIRAGMSQLDLELEIGAASGMISRIENGVVNPTKETLAKVKEALQLDQKEFLNLMGITNENPTDKDIMKVLEHLKNDFENENFYAILLNNREEVIKASKGIYKLWDLDESANTMLGLNLLELILDYQYGFRQTLTNLEEFIPYELALFRAEFESELDSKWSQDLFARLSKLPNFLEYWQMSQSINLSYYPSQGRLIKILVNNQEISLVSNFMKLNIDSRFELIEYLKLN